MTIEQLNEKHVALAQTVQVLAEMQIQSETRTHQVTDMMQRVMGSIEELVRVVASHERRISGLEEGRA